MLVIIVLISIATGTIFSKWFLFVMSRVQFTPLHVYEFVLLPFFFNRKKGSLKLSKSFSTKIYISECLGGSFFGLYSIFLFNVVLEMGLSFGEIIFLQLLLVPIFFLFFYIALFDLFNFFISENLAYKILILSVIVNILGGSAKVMAYFIGGERILNSFQFGDIKNLVSGVVFGLIVFFLVKATKNFSLSSSDIILCTSIGFLLGWPQTFYAFVLSVFIGLGFGIFLIVLKRKMQNLLIPFAPLLFLGTLFTLMLI